VYTRSTERGQHGLRGSRAPLLLQVRRSEAGRRCRPREGCELGLRQRRERCWAAAAALLLVLPRAPSGSARRGRRRLVVAGGGRGRVALGGGAVEGDREAGARGERHGRGRCAGREEAALDQLRLSPKSASAPGPPPPQQQLPGCSCCCCCRHRC